LREKDQETREKRKQMDKKEANKLKTKLQNEMTKVRPNHLSKQRNDLKVREAAKSMPARDKQPQPIFKGG